MVRRNSRSKELQAQLSSRLQLHESTLNSTATSLLTLTLTAYEIPVYENIITALL